MQLDNKTNNTSLVLAFELIDTHRVFLFAADAQVGNWLSWEKTNWKLKTGDVVTGPDLLARTVYYKVGHHGSQNATLEKKGLELTAQYNGANPYPHIVIDDFLPAEILEICLKRFPKVLDKDAMTFDRPQERLK